MVGYFVEIIDFFCIDFDFVGIVVVFEVGGVDEGEFFLIGDGEDDVFVWVLEDVGVGVIEQLFDYDMVVFDQLQVVVGFGLWY